jgi:transcriptional regulator with XRE-family HTH domain
MITTIENFETLVNPVKSGWHEKVKERVENKAWKDKAFDIALKLIRYARENKITQVRLAEMMNVTPQYINKVFQGKENLTLESICKFETILKITLIEVSISRIEKYDVRISNIELTPFLFDTAIRKETVDYSANEYQSNAKVA